MGLKYADDDKVPDTVTTDRNLVFSKVKEMVDLDQLVTGTVDDETVNKVAKVVLTELDFQQIPASDAPDDVHDDRMKVLKVLFPGVKDCIVVPNTKSAVTIGSLLFSCLHGFVYQWKDLCTRVAVCGSMYARSTRGSVCVRTQFHQHSLFQGVYILVIFYAPLLVV